MMDILELLYLYLIVIVALSINNNYKTISENEILSITSEKRRTNIEYKEVDLKKRNKSTDGITQR